MNATVTVNFVVDVNAFIDAFAEAPVVESLADLYTSMPLLAEIAATNGARLVDSDHILEILQHKLVELLDYTEEQAFTATQIVQSVSSATQGSWVQREDGKETAVEITQAVNPRFLGNGKGQIDHEDQQVLGAAYFAKKYDSDDQAKSMIVTRDGGLRNVGSDVLRKGIVVSNTHDALVVLTAMRRHH